MKTATVKLIACVPDWRLSELRPEHVSDPEKLGRVLSFVQATGMAAGQTPQQYIEHLGYAYVGVTEVEVEVCDIDSFTLSAVQMLRAKAVSIRAKASAEAAMWDHKAEQLLAIENKPSSEAA